MGDPVGKRAMLALTFTPISLRNPLDCLTVEGKHVHWLSRAHKGAHDGLQDKPFLLCVAALGKGLHMQTEVAAAHHMAHLRLSLLALCLSLLLEASVDGKDTDPDGVGCLNT